MFSHFTFVVLSSFLTLLLLFQSPDLADAGATGGGGRVSMSNSQQSEWARLLRGGDGRTPAIFPDDASMHRYLSAMDRLNAVLVQASGIGCPPKESTPKEQRAEDGGEKKPCPKKEDFSEAALNARTQRPDMLPYLYEGDIILSPEQIDSFARDVEQRRKNSEEAEAAGFFPERSYEREKHPRNRRKKRTLEVGKSARWSHFPIPFTVSGGVSREAVLAGVASWQQNTCVSFQEKPGLSRGPGLNFVRGNGCYSFIGQQPGSGLQQVSIGAGCENPFTVAHEIAHALGVYHEQARWDRDQFVAVQPGNIRPGFLSQFNKLGAGQVEVFGTPYDLGSVMHYDPFAFAVDGSPSIKTVDAHYQTTIGQRFQLSFADVKKMNFAYCNGTCPRKLDCQRSGYTDPKNCAQCRCPEGLDGVHCESVQKTSTGNACNGGRLQLTATKTAQTLGQRGPGDCNFLIQAPNPGDRIDVTVDAATFGGGGGAGDNSLCPSETYVELRYQRDLGTTGARLCRGPGQPRTITSQGPEVLVLYRAGSSGASSGGSGGGATFSLHYQIH